MYMQTSESYMMQRYCTRFRLGRVYLLFVIDRENTLNFNNKLRNSRKIEAKLRISSFFSNIQRKLVQHWIREKISQAEVRLCKCTVKKIYFSRKRFQFELEKRQIWQNGIAKGSENDGNIYVLPTILFVETSF